MKQRSIIILALGGLVAVTAIFFLYDSYVGGLAVELPDPFHHAKSTVGIYRNDRYGFELSYPSVLKPEYAFQKYYVLSDDWRFGAAPAGLGQALVAIPVFRIVNRSAYPRYFAAELRVGASTDPQGLKDCYNADNTAGPATEEKIGTEIFHKFIIQDAAMMQYVAGVSYRLLHGNACLAIEELRAGSSYRDQPQPGDMPQEVLDAYARSLHDITLTFRLIK